MDMNDIIGMIREGLVQAAIDELVDEFDSHGYYLHSPDTMVNNRAEEFTDGLFDELCSNATIDEVIKRLKERGYPAE